MSQSESFLEQFVWRNLCIWVCMMNQITWCYNLLNIKQMCFTKSPFSLIEYHSSKDTYLSKCQMHLSNALVWKINPLDSQLNSITWQVHSFIPNVCIHLFICYLEKGLPISSKVISDVLIEQLFFSIKKHEVYVIKIQCFIIQPHFSRELQKRFLSCKLSRSFGGTCHTPAFITLDKKKLHLFHIKILCVYCISFWHR